MGSGGGMGGMMEQMGAPKPRDLYPSLMALPDLPLERRREIGASADERMREGLALLRKGLNDLDTAFHDVKPQDMEAASTAIREGQLQFDSGLAAKRALAEGEVPRNVALRWFKREMNLFPLGTTEGASMFGLAPRSFHYSVIVILASFSAAFVWMYFFKMRRAATLLERLAHAEEGTSPAASKYESTQTSITPVAKNTKEADAPVSRVPERPTRWKGTLRVARIFGETPNVRTFRLVDPDGSSIPFSYVPGQFLTLSVTPETKAVKRSYTIASSPTQRDYVEVTVKREEMGLVSRYLHDQVSEGVVLEIAAPSGNFTFTGDEQESIVLIAGGVGITPMMSVIRYLTDRAWPGDIHLVYACRTSGEVIFRDEIEYRKKRCPNLHVLHVFSREDDPRDGAVKGRLSAEILSSRVPGLISARVHICGPAAMMAATKRALFELGLKPDQVKTGAFGPTGGPGERIVPSAATLAKDTGQSPDLVPEVSFVRSGKTAVLPPEKTVLDVADEIGVDIDYSCREGTCGTCKIKLLHGEVTMEIDEGLDPADRAQNVILACQARSSTNIGVDA